MSLRKTWYQFSLCGKSAEGGGSRLWQSGKHRLRAAQEGRGCISALFHAVDSPQEITCAARQLREIAQQEQIAPQVVLEVFDQWAAALDDRELREVPGVTFLRLWLRRGNLEQIGRASC